MQFLKYFSLILICNVYCLSQTLANQTHQVSAQVITLPSLEIEQTKAESSHSTPATIDFSQQQIEEMGSLSVNEFLSKQGSVQIKTNSAQQNQTSISLRGFGGNAASNSLIIIDGIPLTSFSHLPPSLNSIPLDLIDSLSIYLGSHGSLYGNQAVGGVIDIETKVPNRPLNKLTLGIGNQKQKYFDIIINQPLNESLRFSFGGMGFISDHQQPHNLQNNYQFYNYWTYETDSSQTLMALSHFKTHLQIPQSLTWQQPTPILINENETELTNTSARLTHEHSLNENWLWTSRLLIQFETSSGKIGMPFESQQSGQLIINQLTYKDFFKSGIEIQNQNYNLHNRLQNSYVNNQIAQLYGQANWQIVKDLKFTLGARLAKQCLTAEPTNQPKQKTSSQHVLNEQGLSYQLNDKTEVYIRRDINIRFAKANEKIWVIDNIQNLQTQTGTSYETGFRFHNSKNELSLGLFQLTLNNEIDFDPIPTAVAPFGRMYNLPQTKRIGLQASHEYSLNKNIHTTSQLILIKSRFTEEYLRGKQIPGVAPISGSFTINYKLNNSWQINLNQTYSSKTYANEDVLNQSHRTPANHTTNLYIQKQWCKLLFSLQIDNIFNHSTPRFATYYADFGLIKYFPNDGRRLLFKIEYSLN